MPRSTKTRRGRAAPYALNPTALVAFVDSQSKLQVETRTVRKTVQDSDGKTVKKSDPFTITVAAKYVNKRPFDRAKHARVLRRWRNRAEGVTEAAASDFLGAYGLTIQKFKNWAKRNGHKAVAWDNR